MASPAGKNTLDRLERRDRVRELHLDGWSFQAIAKELGVTWKTIERDVMWLERTLTAAIADRLADYKARQTLRIEKLYRRAVAAYERSCEDRKRTSTEAKRKSAARNPLNPEDLGAPDEIKQSTVVEPQRAGNCHFLSEARHCLEEISKLWGLYAPIQTQIVDSEGQDVFGAAVDRMPLDEAKAVIRFIDEVRALRIEEKTGCNGDGKIVDVEVECDNWQKRESMLQEELDK